MAHFTILWLLISCLSTSEFNSVHLIHSLTTPATLISIDTAETTAVSSNTSSTELVAELWNATESNIITLSTMPTTESSSILSIESSLSNTESSTVLLTDSRTESSTESSSLSTDSSIESSSLPTETSTESLSSIGSSIESSSLSTDSSTESSSLSTNSSTESSSLPTGSSTESSSLSKGSSTESSLSTGLPTESSSLSAGLSTESSTKSSAESSTLFSSVAPSSDTPTDYTTSIEFTTEFSTESTRDLSSSAETMTSTELTTYPFNNWYNTSDNMSSEFTSDPSTKSTLGITSSTDCNLPIVDLDGVCGFDNMTWGVCRENSACHFQTETKQGNRTCQCFHGNIAVIDLTGKRSCKKVATELFFNETFYELTMTSDKAVNSQVLNISLDIEDDIKDLVAVNVTLHPSDSFLTTEIHSNAAVSILTSSTLPQSQKTHRFFLEAEMTYGDVIVKDVTSVIVNVIRVFPNSTLIRGTFVIDGTRKGSLVYDISVDLGSIDALALRLSADPSVSLFELSQNSIVCTEEVNLTKLGAREHTIGKLVSVNISNSQKTVLTLHVAVLVSKYRTAVAESSMLGSTIVDFDSLVSSFDISFATQQYFELSGPGNSVLLSHELDYEDIDQRRLNFNLVIALKGNSSVATEVGVEIATLDENDEAPEFIWTDYSFTVSAESPRGTIMGSLEFRDPDTAVTIYTFVIENSQYRSYFQLKQVDSWKGALITSQGLKSLNSSAEFNVTVSDGVNQCTVPALVTVKLSIVPQELEIVGKSFVVSVLEEEPIGVFVVNASLANYTGYMVLDNIFKIDNVTGEITTARSIDREGGDVKAVTVVAKHVDGTCAFKIVSNITVIVLDINDNSPVFSEEGLYRTNLKENSRDGSAVFMVQATDKDEGENATLTFSLSGENSNFFSIDNKTGAITVANSSILDREQIAALEVIVLVEDGGDTLEQALRLSANATLTITLLDVNDNNPRFQQTLYMFSVHENRTANQSVGNVSATDLDLLENSRIRYSLKDGDWGFFWINETTGEMWTKQTINREEHSNFTIVVVAYDNGSPALNGFCTVVINVIDVNDNAPEFDRKHQYVSVKEDIDCINQTIVQVHAKDLDDGVNGEVYYTIENGLLIIDNVTGNVTCSMLGLDFENKTQQDLIKGVRIFAFDRGTPVLNGTLQLTVTLEDVNDNPPTFAEHAPNITVPSVIFKTINSTVFVLSVLDKDSDPQFDLEIFNLTGDGKDLLKIDNQGVVKVKSLRNFTQGQVTTMQYKVVATDKGNKDLQSSTQFTLIVDTPDNGNIGPSKTDFHMTIEENKNAADKTTIGKVDAPQGINTSAIFSLETDDDRFSINRTSGEVYCLAELDRERQEHIILFTNVSVGGWYYYAAVDVEVLDVNDNPPIFSATSQQLITDLYEDAENGTKIIQASASDLDSGLNGNVSYSLLEPNTPFQVNTSNGWIYVNGSLDRENVSQYNLTVVASDHGNPPLNSSITVTITLLDVNDNPPIFNLSYCKIDVWENISSLNKVGQVQAFDRDVNSTGLNYSMEQSTECPFFIQNSNDKGRTVGVLKLGENESLDYETTHNYNCTIRVFDLPNEGPQLNSSMIITFNILDVNDNAPVIHAENQSTNFTIPRDVPQGFDIVKKLIASDNDSGINAEIYFSFDTDFPDYFNVSNDTGEVQTIKSLRDLPSEMVNLTVLARDRGEPSLSSALLIQVIILDNNTAPQFNESIYNVSVKEDVSYMRKVHTVSAVDFEKGRKRQECDCEFFILSALNESGHNVKDYFEINKRTGLISNKIPIDRETIGNKITINLSVTDKGEPPKSDYAVLSITVLDVNDSRPMFDKQYELININQTNCQPGQMSFTVKARDEDLAPNNATTYKMEGLITTTSMPMQIDKYTGELSLTHSLCSEMYNGKTILGSVSAFDHELDGSEPTTLFIAIIVNLSNANANGPKFSQPNYAACLPLNAKAGTPLNIKDFYASDTDGDVIKYAIKNGNLNCSEAVFSIDSLTGVITLNYELGNVLQRYFILTVTATDSGAFSSDHMKTGTAVVNISVLGGNETCYEEKEVAAPKADAKECKIYKTLFIVLTVFLSLIILLTVFLCYKWRTTVSDREEINGNAESGDTSHPSHLSSLEKAGIDGKQGIYKNKKSDLPTIPPSLPRRDGVKGIRCNNVEGTVNPPLCSSTQVDSAGYLTPSEYGQDSNQTLSPHHSRSESAEDSSGYMLLTSDIFIDADSRNPDPAQCSPDYLRPKQMSVKQGRKSERRTNLIEDAKNLYHEISISPEETNM